MTATETAILVWLAIGAGIAGGVFIVARSAVQLGSIAYRVMEKRLDKKEATSQTAMLSAVIVVTLLVTAVIAAYALLVVFGTLLQNSGLSSS